MAGFQVQKNNPSTGWVTKGTSSQQINCNVLLPNKPKNWLSMENILICPHWILSFLPGIFKAEASHNLCICKKN